MAAQGTIMYQDPAVVTPGAVRGWKVGFGYSNKGTVVTVYKVDAPVVSTEIPLLGNGKADTNAVSSWLQAQGVSLTNALKQVIGA